MLQEEIADGASSHRGFVVAYLNLGPTAGTVLAATQLVWVPDPGFVAEGGGGKAADPALDSGGRHDTDRVGCDKGIVG